MKRNWLQAYFNSSKAEHRGIWALITIVGILLLVFWFLPYYPISKKADNPKQRELEVAMQQLQAEEDEPAYADESSIALPTSEPFAFDPNTLDSAGFIKLGLRPKTTHLLLNWRRKGKVFYRKEQFKDVWTLKPEEYERLAPYIDIPEDRRYAYKDGGYKNYERFKQEPLPAHIDLNTTDENTLIRLNGIGPTLAKKIIERREALGGYIKVEQLNEVYHFNDTTFAMLREKLQVRIDAIHKVQLNQATETELAKHPYIGEKMAKNIVLYRDGLKGFQQIQQLRQVPLMNEEIYRKIAPYSAL